MGTALPLSMALTDIVSSAPGKLNVFADDLSAGTYTYTLVVDGQIITSKKMMKQ